MAKTLVKLIILENFIFVYISENWDLFSKINFNIMDDSLSSKTLSSLSHWASWEIQMATDDWKVSWLFLEGSVPTSAESCKNRKNTYIKEEENTSKKD